MPPPLGRLEGHRQRSSLSGGVHIAADSTVRDTEVVQRVTAVAQLLLPGKQSHRHRNLSLLALLCPPSLQHNNSQMANCKAPDTTFQAKWCELTAVERNGNRAPETQSCFPSPSLPPAIMVDPGRGSCDTSYSAEAACSFWVQEISPGNTQT